MVAASEALTTSNSPPTASKRQPWKPDGDAHLIYRWVKMEGKSQGWVARSLNISQPTVSRVVQRYERWQAHAKEREDGRLDPAERLRAQRWLTFERNELILTSCLRIANELEGFIDTSKSVTSHPTSRPSQETKVRTELGRVDRTGMTARFLRLAFRINMEQLELAELAQPPLPQPLSDEVAAEEERQAAADDAELAEARRRIEETVIADLPEQWQERQYEPATENGRVGSARHEAPENNAVGEAHPTSDAERQDVRSHAERGNEITDHSPTHHSPTHHSALTTHDPTIFG